MAKAARNASETTRLGYDFGLDVDVCWYPPVTAKRFVCSSRAPRSKAGVAWVDAKTMKVRKWNGKAWAPIANVTATEK